MKKNSYSIKKFIFLFILIVGIVKHADAQYVNIPDASFRTWLIGNGYAGCMSGSSLDTTCIEVTSATGVYCGNANISDLTGIQYFDSLDTLDCNSNQLTFLPNLPSLLRELDCNYNLLTSLPPLPSTLGVINCYNNQLTSLPALPSSLHW